VTALPYMPLWIEPLLADTEHLTNAEFGAYMRLLCAMWRLGGSIPDDDRLLRRLIHADPRNWPALRDMLGQFVIRNGSRKFAHSSMQNASTRWMPPSNGGRSAPSH
jgi:uncharacterized protein YdaU (DUF1376 family)